ncbi:MAG: hypothetical protein JOY80_13155 [Candidatus Dormibacteraeota bacterium]|nr:hypothetical protein [Candidatus Dormibacteraeota bacterium]
MSAEYQASSETGGTVPTTSPNESDASATVNYKSSQSTTIGSVPAIVSTATATVQGIDLAANVSIGYLQINATSVAGGRAGTASTTITRTISGVQAGAFSCPSSCDPTATLQAINSTLQADSPNQVSVVFPDADPTAAAGTPLGAYAAAYKDTYEYLNDSIVDEDSRPELVGMEVIRDNDAVFGGATSRQITDYGGVEVESRMGITPLVLSTPTTGVAAIANGSLLGGTSGIPGTPGTPGQALAASTSGGGNNGGAGGALLQSVLHGLEALLNWRQLPLMALMWTVLLTPLYLASRRRRLERLAL